MFILKSSNDDIKLKVSYIGDFYQKDENLNYLKWSWSNITLNKASKINLLKIFKYFLEQEPTELSPVLIQIYEAFIQSIIIVDELFYDILINALLSLMKHLFEIRIIDDKKNTISIYLVKEIL